MRTAVRAVRLLTAELVAAACLAILAAAASAAVVGPSGIAFYSPPSPLPTTHGTLVWYRSATPHLGRSAPSVNAWKVLYASQRVDGQTDPVTGTVIVPTAPWNGSGPRPVVDYAVGTQGLSQSSAASMQLVDKGDYESPNIVKALTRDWAVEVTDYAGYTTGAIPDYIVGESEGHAVLDIARAAPEIPHAGISRHAPVAIWGYSQGGQASAWAAELWPSYLPGLDLVGDAAGGVPANLDATAELLNGHLGAAFLIYSVIGLDVDYPSLIDLRSHLNAAGMAAVAKAETQSAFQSLPTFAFKNIDRYTLSGETLDQLLAVPSIRAALSDQSLGRVGIEVPMFHYHARHDEIVPLDQDEMLNHAYCSLGDTVDFRTVALEHLAGDYEGAGPAVSWIADRFAGDPAPDNCSSAPTG